MNILNGEMLQVCSIVAAAKNALSNKESINYTPIKYENNICFSHLPRKKFILPRKTVTKNVENWYGECIARGLADIKFNTLVEVADRNLLGFANAIPNSMVCFYDNGEVTYFTSQWTFKEDIKMWDISYTEMLWNNPPCEKPKYDDNTDNFLTVLSEIEPFARTIGADWFATVFCEARSYLEGSTFSNGDCTIPLPAKNKRLFMAADKADVFGAMGSWNDSPPYQAHEKGLTKEFDDLSAKLLQQIRLALLYSVNEW